jgi:hypothetical protein
MGRRIPAGHHRNTIFRQIAAGPGRPITNTIERNVIVGPWVPSMQETESRTVIWRDNLELTSANAMTRALNSDYGLSKKSAKYLGKVGHEIVIP